MQPRTRVRGGISYDRYAFNRQIYCADTYPFSAPDGSKIVVCGHESGVLILWKDTSPSRESRNGDQQADSESDTDMNEEEQFEDIESNSMKQPPKSIQKLDLPLGTAVLHLSFPPLPQLQRPQEVPQAPSLLQQHLVVALACADNTIRLLTVPLKASSALLLESKKHQQGLSSGSVGKGIWGERMVTISNAHQKVPRGVALAFVSRRITEDGSQDNGSMDAIIASHAADVTGSLLIHRIPVISGKELFGTPELWRSSHLASPACSLDMFISSVSGTTPKILIGESNGVVRVFECGLGKQQSGQWSLSLFAPETKAEHYGRSILSASWILEGRAIAVLTGEGEWGIWNISYGGPGRGITANRPNPFTIAGRVGIMARTASRKSASEATEAKSQLAPMTPATRKMKQEGLFTGKMDSAETRGGISVKRTISSYSTGEVEESLLFWFGDNVVYLPNLQAYWQNKLRGASGMSSAPASSNPRDVSLASFGEDTRISISAFSLEDPSAAYPDFLVVGERSLVVAISESDSRVSTEYPATNQSRGSDQSLLSGGLLDVNGLGRILDGMRSNRSSAASGSLTQRKVLFE